MTSRDAPAQTSTGGLSDAVLESSPLGVIVLGPDYEVVLWNEVVERLTDISAADVLGQDIRSIFPEFSSQRYAARLEETRRAGVPAVFHGAFNRGLFRMPGGEIRLPHYRITCRRLSTSTSEPSLVIWVENTTLLDETTEYLRSEIAARGKVEEQLESAVRSREVLYRELQHRVKNSLALISSLVSLAAHQARVTETQNALEEIHTRVSTIAMVYNQLSSAPRYGELDLAEYLSQLVAALVDSLARPYCMDDPELDLSPCLIPVDAAVSLGLIVNEVVTNAIKHAFPGERSGRISVSLKTAGESDPAILVIGDNGIGMTGKDAADGLGLGLIDMLARQVGGELERLDRPGTWYRITFPRVDPPGL